MTEPLSAQDPRQVGAYRLLGRLGAGGMGEVFLGESPGQRKVAVKLLRAEHARDTQFRQRFAREVAAAKQVGGFHTAQVVDADPDADPPWLVTAYIPGPSLAAEVKEHGPLDPEAVRLLGAALAEGVAAIHACGLVHRDLKPANIILAGDGPRIIDFGVARTPGASDLTSTGVVVGTVSFMSPEQIGGERVDARSDVFSLGGVLTYAATGHGPFDAPATLAIMHRIASQPPDLDGVDGPLREIIAGCLAKDPGQRPGLAALTPRLTGAVREATYVPPVHDQHQFPPERIEAPAPVPTVPAPAPAAAPVPPPQAPSIPAPGPPAPAPARPARKRGLWAAVSAVVVAVAAAASILGYQLAGGANAKQPAAAAPKPPATTPNQPAASPSPSVISPPPPVAVPDSYLGRWAGKLRRPKGQTGAENPTFTITKGKVGAVVGYGSYPNPNKCPFKFTLVSARSDKVTLYQTIQGRGGFCVPHVAQYVVLTPSGQGLQDKEYQVLPSQGDTLVFTGRLSHPAGS